jgi:large subunit ribosomal protein L9
MEVILLERVSHVGNLGDRVKVKAGFARNFLIPKGKALFANAKNVTAFEARRAEFEKTAHGLLSVAQQRAEKLNALVINVSAQASEEGKLYGSVGTKEIADAVTQAGVELSRKEVLLPEGVIRSLGEYDISLQLHSDVVAKIKLHIEAEG